MHMEIVCSVHDVGKRLQILSGEFHWVALRLSAAGPCRSCMMTLQMPPDLLHFAEAATAPTASRREVCKCRHSCVMLSVQSCVDIVKELGTVL